MNLIQENQNELNEQQTLHLTLFLFQHKLHATHGNSLNLDPIFYDLLFADLAYYIEHGKQLTNFNWIIKNKYMLPVPEGKENITRLPEWTLNDDSTEEFKKFEELYSQYLFMNHYEQEIITRIFEETYFVYLDEANHMSFHEMVGLYRNAVKILETQKKKILTSITEEEKDPFFEEYRKGLINDPEKLKYYFNQMSSFPNDSRLKKLFLYMTDVFDETLENLDNDDEKYLFLCQFNPEYNYYETDSTYSITQHLVAETYLKYLLSTTTPETESEILYETLQKIDNKNTDVLSVLYLFEQILWTLLNSKNTTYEIFQRIFSLGKDAHYSRFFVDVLNSQEYYAENFLLLAFSQNQTSYGTGNILIKEMLSKKMKYRKVRKLIEEYKIVSIDVESTQYLKLLVTHHITPEEAQKNGYHSLPYNIVEEIL